MSRTLFAYGTMACVCVGALVISIQQQNAQWNEVQAELAGLDTKLEANTKALAELKLTVEGIPQIGAVSSALPTPESAFGDQLRDLSLGQTELAGRLQQLLDRSSESAPPSPDQRQRMIVTLEKELSEHQQALNAAKAETEALLIHYAVPDEIATLDPSKGIDQNSLQRYKPYFEARQRRAELELLCRSISLRLYQERFDFKAATATP